jgi:hypothetical protein
MHAPYFAERTKIKEGHELLEPTTLRFRLVSFDSSIATNIRNLDTVPLF